MTSDPRQVARELVLAVLRGEVTRTSHSWLFDEDEVSEDVRWLEDNDWTWLAEQLRCAAHRPEHRDTVCEHLSPAGRNKLGR